MATTRKHKVRKKELKPFLVTQTLIGDRGAFAFYRIGDFVLTLKLARNAESKAE